MPSEASRLIINIRALLFVVWDLSFLLSNHTATMPGYSLTVATSIKEIIPTAMNTTSLSHFMLDREDADQHPHQ